jgi:hypothetical protein
MKKTPIAQRPRSNVEVRQSTFPLIRGSTFGVRRFLP